MNQNHEKQDERNPYRRDWQVVILFHSGNGYCGCLVARPFSGGRL